MRYSLSLCTATLAMMVLASCGREEPKPVPPPSPSAWTANDSHQVSDDIIGEAMKHPWATEFKDRTGQWPLVRIGEINDRSQGQIDVPVLVAQLAHSLEQSGKVRIETQPTVAADFVVKGSVSEQDEQKQGQPVKYYDVDLLLVDAKNNPVCALPREVTKDDSLPPAPAVVAPAGQ